MRRAALLAFVIYAAAIAGLVALIGVKVAHAITLNLH